MHFTYDSISVGCELTEIYFYEKVVILLEHIRCLGIVASGSFGICGFLRCAILVLCLGQPLVVNRLNAVVLLKYAVPSIDLKVPHNRIVVVF